MNVVYFHRIVHLLRTRRHVRRRLPRIRRIQNIKPVPAARFRNHHKWVGIDRVTILRMGTTRNEEEIYEPSRHRSVWRVNPSWDSTPLNPPPQKQIPISYPADATSRRLR